VVKLLDVIQLIFPDGFFQGAPMSH